MQTDFLFTRVKDRFLNKVGVSVGEPKELLIQFRNLVEASKITGIEKSKELLSHIMVDDPRYDDLRSEAYKAFFIVTGRTPRSAPLTDVGDKLFLSILQSYNLPPNLRKKVEIASRLYTKKVKPRVKSRSGTDLYLEYFELYEKYFDLISSHLSYATEAIEKGVLHTEEGPQVSKFKVGDFNLINTGGFTEKVMQEVSDIVQKVQALSKSAGLGEVCYGDIQVTNTLMKGSILAFYQIAADELFIRGNLKGSTDILQTVLHELGHRYEHKFLANAKAGTSRLYRILDGQEDQHTEGLRGKKPAIGEEVTTKGKTYKVVTTIRGKQDFNVILEQVDQPGNKATVTLSGWLALKGGTTRDFETDPNYLGFVSNYAKKGGPSENFAEMFSYYCMGKLPILQSGPFEELVFGTKKTAQDQSILRVASRWILEG